MKKTLLLASAVAAALTASAGTVTQTFGTTGGPITGAPSNPPFNGSFSVPKFNSNLGTLSSITLNLKGSSSSSVLNNGNDNLNLSGSVTVSFGISTTPALNGNNVHPVAIVGLAPGGSTSLGSIVNTFTGNATDLANWQSVGGVGTVSVPLAVTTGSSLSGGSTFQLTTLAQADLEVVYTYRTPDVPEPSFYGAMGALVCFGLLGYRQYRAKQNA